MNPTEHAELKRQVDELMKKNFIKKHEPLCGTHSTDAKKT